MPRTWRFVLFVDPAPQASPQNPAPKPVVLEPEFVRGLGPGATLLKEPYERTVKIRFDWPANTQVQALAAAIRAVDAAGLQVLRVDNDDWVTTADVAHRAGKSRETIRQWAAGHSGAGGFPPPANPRRDTTFYSWAEVQPWLRQHTGVDLPDEQPALVAANLTVQLRSLLPRLPLPHLFIDLLT